jgi:hypothetical protein
MHIFMGAHSFQLAAKLRLHRNSLVSEVRHASALTYSRVHAPAHSLFVLHQFFQTPAEASVWIDASLGQSSLGGPLAMNGQSRARLEPKAALYLHGRASYLPATVTQHRLRGATLLGPMP